MEMLEIILSKLELVKEGEVGAIETFKELYKEVKQVNECFEEIKSLALKEAEKYNKEELFQIGIERRSGGVSGYDYSGNETWNELSKKIAYIQKCMQNATKLCCSFVDEETGEVYEPAKIKGYKKDSISLSYK